MRSLDLEHTYQEWAAVYSDHEDEVLVTTLANWPLPTRDEIVGRIFIFLVPFLRFSLHMPSHRIRVSSRYLRTHVADAFYKYRCGCCKHAWQGRSDG